MFELTNVVWRRLLLRTKCVLSVFAFLFTASLPTAACAHLGRRLQVFVDDGGIVLQGVNTGTSDGQEDIRPYPSAIHDHWANSPLGFDSATAIFPEFDILPGSSALADHALYLRLDLVQKWSAPPLMPESGVVPLLSTLGPGERVSVSLGGTTVTSDALGQLILSPNVPGVGVEDIGLLYEINTLPQNEIHVLEFTLISGNGSLSASDPFFVILSPDGDNAAERLHHASLYIEAYLGAGAVPEPSGFLIAAGLFNAMLLRGRLSSHR